MMPTRERRAAGTVKHYTTLMVLLQHAFSLFLQDFTGKTIQRGIDFVKEFLRQAVCWEKTFMRVFHRIRRATLQRTAAWCTATSFLSEKQSRESFLERG